MALECDNCGTVLDRAPLAKHWSITKIGSADSTEEVALCLSCQDDNVDPKEVWLEQATMTKIPKEMVQ